MENETVLTDTKVNTGIEEKPTENVSPTVEMGNDKNLQPKTGIY